MYGQGVEISETLRVVSDCWEAAEQNLATDVHNWAPHPDEEFITDNFAVQLGKVLDQASSRNRIADAFLSDLLSAGSSIPWTDLQAAAQGLKASLRFDRHRRGGETRTGADLGLLLVRPHVEVSYGRDEVEIAPNTGAAFWARRS